MARQNAGNPKFYIDYLSYWKAKGNIEGYGSSNGTSVSSQLNRLIGLNPSDYLNADLDYDTENVIRIDLKDGIYMPRGATDKFFIGALGHNFFNIINKDFNLYLKGHESQGNETVFDTNDITMDTICNFPTDGSAFEYNGWSLGEWTGGDSDSFYHIYFTIGSDSANITNQTILGNLVFGSVFQMPHSPDLKLTMTREYDGIEQQTTRGGSTLTQINYHNAPDWAGAPAWELYTGNTINYINNDFIETRDSARGRRVWDLKFSYIDYKDMMPINELVNIFNPTDSNTNSGAGYDTNATGTSEDFNPSGNFSTDIRRDSSFMGVVMEKTIGGSLPFIFQPDGNNNSPDQFAICMIEKDSFSFEQVANGVYDISLKIREVW